MIPLAANTVTRNNLLYIIANVQNYARITITCVSGKSRHSSRLTTVYIIVYFRTHANGSIFVLNQYSIVRYRRKIILLQSDLTEIGVGKSTWAQCNNLMRGVAIYRFKSVGLNLNSKMLRLSEFVQYIFILYNQYYIMYNYIYLCME